MHSLTRAQLTRFVCQMTTALGAILDSATAWHPQPTGLAAGSARANLGDLHALGSDALGLSAPSATSEALLIPGGTALALAVRLGQP